MHHSSIWLILPPLFFAVMWAFIPLGRKLGRLLSCEPPIRAYSIDIAGSLLGVVTFSILSYLRLGPLSWFLVGLLPLCLISRRPLANLAWSGLMLLVLAASYLGEEQKFHWKNIWTPYYNLKVYANPPGPDGRPQGFAAFVSNFFLLRLSRGQSSRIVVLPGLQRTLPVTASILIVILVGNAIVASGRGVNRGPFYIALLASLVALFAWPIESIRTSGPLATQVLACSLQTALPVLFASVIFAISFARASVADAFASNLPGAVLIAMLIGLRSLALVALLLYAASGPPSVGKA